MSTPFVAEIRIFASNFAPTGWAVCNGQLLPISQYTALFSLIGTFYGGDGKSTFALPNLAGSAAMQPGEGAGLSPSFLGDSSGSEAVTLLDSEMPAHAHAWMASAQAAEDRTPGGEFLGRATGGNLYTLSTTPQVQLAPQAVSIAGGAFPHNNMQPSLTLTFCIALQGIFPARW